MPGVRPGGRVTFLCLAREKSPKERRFFHFRARHAFDALKGVRSEPLRSRVGLIPALPHRTSTPVDARLNAGLTTQMQRRSGDAAVRLFSQSSAFSRDLSGREVRSFGLVISRRRERSGSLQSTAEPEQRERTFQRDADCIEAPLLW